jgi:hypothetical protein
MIVSTYSIEQLLTIWKQDTLTTEQAVGHLLQHLALVYERLRAVEKRACKEPEPEQPSAQGSDKHHKPS